MFGPNWRATVVADSISHGQRITTLQLSYWRAIHGELMTHRVFSRNAMSSRAVPITKMIEQVLRYAVQPLHWGSNKPGMQAGAQLEGDALAQAIAEWNKAAVSAARHAQVLSDVGLHKQVANRILEPFQWMHTIVTATDWDNFWALRVHPAAMPEMQHLATLMRGAYDASTPMQLDVGDWHLPYVTEEEYSQHAIEVALKLSTARCARVSFLNHDNSSPIVAKDIKLHDDLVAGDPKHASPSEHQATPWPLPDGWADSGSTMSAWGYVEHTSRWGNFKGWNQYRKYIEDGSWEVAHLL